jgi:hypothetical protein
MPDLYMIAGPNGSGKSTYSSLLLPLYLTAFDADGDVENHINQPRVIDFTRLRKHILLPHFNLSFPFRKIYNRFAELYDVENHINAAYFYSILGKTLIPSLSFMTASFICFLLHINTFNIIIDFNKSMCKRIFLSTLTVSTKFAL